MYLDTMRKSVFFPVIFMLASGATLCNAELLIISHPSQSWSLESDDIARIFLSKTTNIDGEKIVPLYLKTGDPVHTKFIEKVLNKSETQLKSYWSRLVFTGKAKPPKDVSTQSDMLKLVAENPQMVGYIEAGNLTPAVKVIASYKTE